MKFFNRSSTSEITKSEDDIGLVTRIFPFVPKSCRSCLPIVERARAVDALINKAAVDIDSIDSTTHIQSQAFEKFMETTAGVRLRTASCLAGPLAVESTNVADQLSAIINGASTIPVVICGSHESQ